MTIQLSNCCKATIDLDKTKERPECYTCSKCGRIIGSPLPPKTNEEWVADFDDLFKIVVDVQEGELGTITTYTGGLNERQEQWLRTLLTEKETEKIAYGNTRYDEGYKEGSLIGSEAQEEFAEFQQGGKLVE